LVSDPGTAATFAGAIAAATLAFVAVVFATTLVAIQLAASQYSPRTVRDLHSLPGHPPDARVVPGHLRLLLDRFGQQPGFGHLREAVAPVVSVTTLLALTLATVFGFVAYLHGVVRLMRVQYLLEAIAAETRRAIEENFPPASAYVTPGLLRRTLHRAASATPGRPASSPPPTCTG
jgi:uncharacterized membrane protein